MKIHFFTAPFYFAFICFRVQGSRFRALVAASPPFFGRWYSRIVKANTGYVEKKNNDGQSLPPRGEGGEQSEPDRVLAG